MLHGDASGLDGLGNDYYYHNNGDYNGNEFDCREFHVDVAGLKNVDDYDCDDDGRFDGIEFLCVSINYEGVFDHCHYTSKYGCIQYLPFKIQEKKL